MKTMKVVNIKNYGITIKILINFNNNGYILHTPYSTTFCDNIDELLDDIETFVLNYMEVKDHEKQKKR